MISFSHLRSTLLAATAVFVFGTAVLPAVVSAQPNFDLDIELPGGKNDPQKGTPAQQRILNLIVDIINIMLGLSAVLALGAMVWGALQIITSGGNEDKVKKGKAAITWAVVGLILIALSFVIIFFIGQRLGVIN